MWDASFDMLGHRRWRQRFDAGRREPILNGYEGDSPVSFYRYPAHRRIDEYLYEANRNTGALERCNKKTSRKFTERRRMHMTATRNVDRVLPKYGCDNTEHWVNHLSYEALRHRHDFVLI